MRVLLVEPFYGGSHRDWADGYARHSTHTVHLVTHPDRRWRWRLRGAALTLAEDVARFVDEYGRPDVVLVSDMVDVAGLLGHARRSIGDVPVALYVHESQLLYGAPGRGGPDRRLALVNWSSLAAADLVLFNSGDHRRRLLDALPAFLDEVADERHRAHVGAVAGRTEVMPVGVDLSGLDPGRRPPPDGGPPLVVWNHRWEWDKQPEVALAALTAVAERGVDFRLALAGQQPERPAPELARLVAGLGDRVVHEGHLPRPGYVDLLCRGDVVLSTAIQEFFGVAMVEAMAAGAVPVLPDDLAYPEIVPDEWHPAVLYPRSATALVDRLAAVLADLPSARAAVEGLAGSMRRFDWTVVAPAYDDRLRRLSTRGR